LNVYIKIVELDNEKKDAVVTQNRWKN